ncbi:MAG: hypothetical protein ACK4IX_08335, partial [Candidatus Sericytochromatia bacterium]
IKKFYTNLFVNLIITCINPLIKNLENSEGKHLWENAFLKLEFLLQNDENGDENLSISEKNIAEKLFEKAYLSIFKELTQGVSIVKTKDTISHEIPEHINKKLNKLSELEQSQEMYKLFNPEIIVIKPIEEKPAVLVKFEPLNIDLEANTKKYEVIVKLDIGNSKPYSWKKEAKDNYWTRIKDHVLQNKQLDIFSTFQAPEIKPEKITLNTFDKNTQLIKTSLHTELQKFGKKPKKYSSSVMDLLSPPIEDEVSLDISQYRIEVIGIDNTKSQNQALFAIQKLLHSTNYKGNTEGKNLDKDDNSFKFMGYLPIIQFTPSEYLEAYGVSKKQTSRGKFEFNSNERSEALKALRELSEKKYLFHYTRKYWKDGKEKYDLVTTVRSLFNLSEKYESLEKSEVESINITKNLAKLEEKLGFIVLEPCPLLVDQIDNYFVLKPANYYQEIKLLVGKTSKNVPLFIDFLITEQTKKEIAAKGKEINWTIEMNYETLAYKLRMEKLVETQQVKRIKTELNKCYEVAKKLGYLIEYNPTTSSEQNLERLILNPEKFKRVKEVNEEIKKIESKNQF